MPKTGPNHFSSFTVLLDLWDSVYSTFLFKTIIRLFIGKILKINSSEKTIYFQMSVNAYEYILANSILFFMLSRELYGSLFAVLGLNSASLTDFPIVGLCTVSLHTFRIFCYFSSTNLRMFRKAVFY